MNARPKMKYSSIRQSIMLMMLGMCVFFWGFGYKLSLYETNQPTLHRIPNAKLLSKNEDPSATDSIRLCLASAASFPVSLIFLTGLLMLACERCDRLTFDRITLASEIPGPHLRFIRSALFFRPPPIHFVL